MDRAVLLLNLGGPEKRGDVRNFLFRLFDDPEILRISFTPLRRLIAWLISTLRHKSSQELYAKIGGGSPIRRLTEEQAAALENELRKKGLGTYVRVAFSCSHPIIEDVVKNLAKGGVREFHLLPLFPHFSLTTTKGVLSRARAAIKRFVPEAKITETRSFCDHPLFIEAHRDLIAGFVSLNKKENAPAHLLFSAHSVPEKMVTKYGDTYKEETIRSAKKIVEALDWKDSWSLAWQSKLGPVKWLEPSTLNEIRRLGGEGIKTMVVVPISFVSDHLETLYEMDQLFAEEAARVGIRDFIRVPGLNCHPSFIRLLVTLSEGVTH